jgi:hypothetical protein
MIKYKNLLIEMLISLAKKSLKNFSFSIFGLHGSETKGRPDTTSTRQKVDPRHKVDLDKRSTHLFYKRNMIRWRKEVRERKET